MDGALAPVLSSDVLMTAYRRPESSPWKDLMFRWSSACPAPGTVMTVDWPQVVTGVPGSWAEKRTALPVWLLQRTPVRPW